MGEERIEDISLGMYRQVYLRDHFTCVYCGFDGRSFEAYLAMSVDHVRPKQQDGPETADNLVVACRACNSFTSRMTFKESDSIANIKRMKQERIRERRRKYHGQWMEVVAKVYLDKPLPVIPS